MIQGVVIVVVIVVAMVVDCFGSILVCSYYVALGEDFKPKAWRGFLGGNYSQGKISIGFLLVVLSSYSTVFTNRH